MSLRGFKVGAGKVILGRPSGTGGAPGATRGGVVSKSATKAPRAGIGRGGNRGISTILLARPDSIGAFVADLDTDRVRTGSDWSHATRAPHLSQVPLLAAPPGAEHGAPGGSFRGAPDCEAVRTAQSCGNRRTHPGRGPERSSQGARIGSGPWAPLAPDPATERPCNRFGHTPPHKPHTPHPDTPRITFQGIRCDHDQRGRGSRRIVYCAPFPLLRPFTLYCTRKRGEVEGEEA